ncbi:hypothetical protein QUV83_06970 [Cellulomonas cellasea]|uniref:hypothetical protein n=1 Tax=Cellulomonas cellasea TaxID=43670 RepID=UPI0025A38BE8|nr:hypothetical protein [Cellulomonas cellasea]MDM8084498.1 hypothetical protein [Cellulomonas cellasea]
MANPPEARLASTAGMTLLVPASWWVIALGDDVGLRRSVADLVDEQVGRRDQDAALRAALRARLTASAAQAAAAGGTLMAISLMTVEGVPVPATMTTYRVPGLTLDDAGLSTLVDALASSDAVPDALDIAPGQFGPVVRRVCRRAGDDDLGATEITMLVVDYWLDAGDGGPVVQLTFSSPMVQVAAALLDLFDTVASSVGPDDVAP